MLCKRIISVSVMFAFAAASAPAVADDILAGIDLLTTPPGDSYTDAFNTDVGGIAIPAGFFGLGSDPWSGRIDLEGKPFTFKPEGPCLEDADTIVRRLEDATFLGCGPGFPVEIDIEIVALNLVASQPITVTFNGGQDSQQWDVRLCVDPTLQTPGTMTLRHDCAPLPGGTFDSVLPVKATVIFTHAEQQVTLAPNIEDIFTVLSGFWVHQSGISDVTEVGPGAIVNSKCGVFTLTEGTTNFVPGIGAWGPEPDEQKKELNAEQAALAAHGVLPAQDPVDSSGGPGGGPNGIPDSCEAGASIPTVSEWGMIVLTVLLLTAGAVLVGRRRRPELA